MGLTSEEKRQRQREHSRKSYRKHREKTIERVKRWNKANPEKRQENHRRWVERNPERARELGRAANVRRRSRAPEVVRAEGRRNMQRRRSRDPAGERERHRQWRQANRGSLNMQLARFRARRKQAMPRWLTKAQHAEIKAIYVRAKKLGCHVDHIVPLNGRNVSGLHVPWNLQILTPHENKKKYNTFDVEPPQTQSIAGVPRSVEGT